MFAFRTAVISHLLLRTALLDWAENVQLMPGMKQLSTIGEILAEVVRLP
jgi:hypothetical protein